MTERLLRVLGWLVFAVATAWTVATFTFTRPPIEGIPPSNYVDAAFVVAFWVFAPVGALIVSKVPRSRIGWIMLGIGFLQSLAGVSWEYALHTLVVAPGSLPAGALAAWLSQISWAPGIALIGFLMLLFPNGKFLSRRWRWLAYLIAAMLTTIVVIGVFAAVRSDSPKALLTGDEWQLGSEILNTIGQGIVMVMFGGLVLSMVSFIFRFRRSMGLERQQLKWLAFPAGCVAALLVISFFILQAAGLDNTSVARFTEFLLNLAAGGIPVAIGIAILRHRLFDIDVIINKTFVYGALAALITALYLGLVIGVGTLLGSESNVFLSIVATALIAAAFQPLRRRLQEVGNRLVYGERVTPYEAMAEFSHQMAGAPSVEEILPRMAEVAAKGTNAVRSRVSVFLATGDSRTVYWPKDEHSTSFDLNVSIDHRGERIGEIAVAKPRSEPISSTEGKLLTDLATQAGPALSNVRLTEELRASRQRLVAAQDEERRRMERDIHDGAQQQLVAIAVKLGLAESLMGRDEQKARGLLSEVRSETSDAVETIRDLARGVFPPILAERGLVAALESHIGKLELPARVRADVPERLDEGAEAAVYFVVREALQNASKHAPRSEISVDLSSDDGHLSFSVSDSGPGFDIARTKLGSGLQNMKDRIEALGGDFEIESREGSGTRVRGRLPLNNAQGSL